MLAAVSDSIKSAVCMIDGQLKDSSELLDAFGKKKQKTSRKGSNTEELKTLNVTLYIPCVSYILPFTSPFQAFLRATCSHLVTVP